jgi:WD40 repeat protein
VCECHPGWPYLRFTRDGRLIAVLEQLIMDPGLISLDDGRGHGIMTRKGWRRLNLSAHAEWLAYQDCESGAVEIWSFPEVERLERCSFPQEVTVAEFRPDGRQLACLLGRDFPGIWWWEAGKRNRPLGGNRVFSWLTYSGDSRFLAAAADDRRIHLWNAHTMESVAIAPPQEVINGLGLNEDGSWLAAGAGEEVRIWESRGGLARSLGVGEPVWRIYFSPRGDLLAVVHEKGVQLWNARTGERFGAYEFAVDLMTFQLTFRPDGAAAAWGNSLRAGGGPMVNPPLGFLSLDSGGMAIRMHQVCLS